MPIHGVGNSPYDTLRVAQQKLQNDDAKAKGTKNSSSSDSDNVSVSEHARLLSTALSTAQKTPDTRADKISKLKQQVQSGQYTPDSHHIAQKMVEADRDIA